MELIERGIRGVLGGRRRDWGEGEEMISRWGMHMLEWVAVGCPGAWAMRGVDGGLGRFE